MSIAVSFKAGWRRFPKIRGRQLSYDVTIRTRGGEPLESRIISFAQGYGAEAALKMGLAYFAPVGRVGHAVISGGLMLMRPTRFQMARPSNGTMFHPLSEDEAKV